MVRAALIAWRVTPLAVGARMPRRTPDSGRWHRGDKPVIYASLDPALAALEALAHLTAPLQPHALLKLHLRGVKIDGPPRLPKRWKHAKHLTRRIGEDWLRDGVGELLRVPSALCVEATNVLIAAERLQPGMLRVQRVGPFRFDHRLIAGLKPGGARHG